MIHHARRFAFPLAGAAAVVLASYAVLAFANNDAPAPRGDVFGSAASIDLAPATGETQAETGAIDRADGRPSVVVRMADPIVAGAALEEACMAAGYRGPECRCLSVRAETFLEPEELYFLSLVQAPGDPRAALETAGLGYEDLGPISQKFAALDAYTEQACGARLVPN